MAQLSGVATLSDTKPCALCGKELESALDDWEFVQPYGGGEIVMEFTYGSRKFDLSSGTTMYQGVICDECAEKMVDRMQLSCVDFQGNPVAPLDTESGN